MAYILEEQYSSPNFTAPANCVVAFGYARVIGGYTYHHWNRPGLGDTYASTIGTLCNDFRNPGSRGVSAHFVADVKRLACLVSPINAAWHAGNGKGNATTIGIECNPSESEEMYQTLIEFQAWLFSRYGVYPLYHHCDWTATECPGTYDLDRIYREALALFKRGAHKAPTVAPSAKPAPVKHNLYVADLHWEVDRGNTLGIIANQFKVSVEAIAKYNGIKAPYVIHEGEKIWPPVGYGTWKVEKGDTLMSIAKWCEANWNKTITVEKIKNSNGLNSDHLTIGMRLNIPK